MRRLLIGLGLALSVVGAEVACASAPVDYCLRPDVLCMPAHRPSPSPSPYEYGPVFTDDRMPIEACRRSE